MANFEGLIFRTLNEADLDSAVALSSEAGWNQTADDWRLMIRGGRTFGVEAPDGCLAASALAYVYEERVAWIAMVLVTADWQRQGIATELMRRAVAQCRDDGLITGLDATPAGREVYLPLGFRDIYRFTRLEAADHALDLADATASPIERSDLDAVVAYDRRVSGMDRRPLIESLWQRQPGHAFKIERASRIRGIALARDGRRAYQLGPLLADDSDTALDLARTVLRQIGGPVFVDLLDDKTNLKAALEAAGFELQRGYIRMLLERTEPLEQVERVFAVTGPEFG